MCARSASHSSSTRSRISDALESAAHGHRVALIGGATQYVSPSQSTLRGNISFHITPSWSMQWTTGYDFELHQFSDHVVSLQRDMHDWRAIFAFTQAPNGNFAFNFYISLIAEPNLKFNYDRRTYRPQPRNAVDVTPGAQQVFPCVVGPSVRLEDTLGSVDFCKRVAANVEVQRGVARAVQWGAHHLLGVTDASARSSSRRRSRAWCVLRRTTPPAPVAAGCSWRRTVSHLVSLNGAIQLSWDANSRIDRPDLFDHYNVYSTSYDLDNNVCDDAHWALEGTSVSEDFLVSGLSNGFRSASM